jgi:hypothetical protein
MACTNCGNTKCNKLNCGCKDTYLTTPAPCPTPEDCPEAQPCSFITDSFCVAYNGEDIICNEEIVVESGDRLQTSLQKIINFFCKCYDIDLTCLNVLSDNNLYISADLDTNPISALGVPNETLYNGKSYYTIYNEAKEIIGYLAWSIDNNRWEFYPDWDNGPVCLECCPEAVENGLYYSETESIESATWVNVCDSPFDILSTTLGEVVDLEPQTCISDQDAYTALQEGLCIITEKISDITLDWSCIKEYPENEPVTYNLLQQAFRSVQDVICFLNDKVDDIPEYVVESGSSDITINTVTNSDTVTYTVTYTPQEPIYVNLNTYPAAGAMGLWSDPANTGTITYTPLQTQVVSPGVYEIETSIVVAYYEDYSAVALNVGTWDGATFTPASNFAFHSANKAVADPYPKWRTLNLHIPDLTVIAGQSIAFSIASNNPNDFTKVTVFGQRSKILKIG